MNHLEPCKLKKNSLGLIESVVMGIVDTAPAYSLFATTALLIAALGLQFLGILIFCGLIMFGVSIAFHQLNLQIPSAGVSYTWVSRVFHLVLGFFGSCQLFFNPVASFSFDQSSISNPTFKSFPEGILVALFFYWGWDVTANLSEETKKKNDTPGKGANIALLIVILLFSSFLLSIQLIFTEKEVQKSGTNLVFTLAEKLFPDPWSYAVILVVMLSTIGTIKTTILQFTRTMYAKGRDGILHPRYANLHAVWESPWKATALIAAIGTLLLIFSAFFPTVNSIIDLSIKGIGFQIAFYYGLTSFACALGFRKTAITNLTDFIFLICWLIASGLFMTFIFIICAITLDWQTTLFGIGSIALGTIPFLLNRARPKL